MAIKREEIHEHLKSLGDPPTKMYAGQLPLFPIIYRLEVRLDDEPSSHRVFFQMSRAETGIRYVNEDFIWKGMYFDAALSVGYAFNQDFSTGHDVRDLDPLTELSDEPFIGLIIRGRF